jgi:hypothetical protein
MLKSGPGWTVKVTDALCTRVPELPEAVSVYVPAGVAVVVQTLAVIVPVPPVIVVGEKVAVAPVGNPDRLGVTVPVNPFTAATVNVYVVQLPELTV